MHRLARAILLPLLLFVPPGARAQMMAWPVLSAPLQLELAQAAHKACAAQGLDVSVAIADPAGVVRTQISGDTTDALSIDAARRKAHTAARLGYATSLLEKAATEAPAYVEFLRSSDPQVIMLGGGLPIRVHGLVAGALAVSGAPRPDLDEACAKAALAALADKLT